MSSSKRDRRRKEMPAVKTIKINAQVHGWLDFLGEATGASFSEIIGGLIKDKYPNIEEQAKEFERRRSEFKQSTSELLDSEE